MAKLEFGVSPTSVIIRVKLMNSSVTTGAGLTGLSSASSGLVISTIKSGEATPTTYTVAGSTIETIATLGTYAAPTATKCRFKEVDATNHPGVYEIQLADARFASTDALLISVSGATNLAQADIEIQTSNRPANMVQVGGQSASASGTVTFPNATLASTTNITAGTITTVTNLTNERSKYMHGSVWISAAGASGTVSYTNGIMTNPVTGIADAKTIADNLLLKKFYTQAGSTVTLIATMNGYVFDGWGWVLALGGQAISNSVFMNARSVTGVSSSSGPTAWPVFMNCEFGATATIPASNCHHCEFGGTVTLVGGGNYDFVDCASVVAGTSTPIFDVNSVAGTNISFRRWSGGITINNIAASTVISIDMVSGGTVTLNGVGGNVQVRGMASSVVDNRTGSPTLGQNAVVNQTTIATPTNITAGTVTTVSGNVNGSVGSVAANGISDASFASATDPKAIRTATAQAGSAAGYIQLDSGAEAVIDDLYVGCTVKIVSGTGAGQSRTVVLYTASTRLAYVDRVWAVTPNATSVFVITAGQLDPECNHAGIAVAATGNTLTLAANASAVNNFYDGANITIVSGQGVGQTRSIGTYVGATKIASLTDGWAVTPNTTSVYLIRTLGDIVTGGFSAGAVNQMVEGILVTPANKLATDVAGAAFADVTKINASSVAAVQLAKSAETIVSGTVNVVDFTPTTTQFETADLTDPAADFYKTRTVIFTSGSLDNQARAIIASSYNAGTGKTRLTVAALTAAPATGVGFNIV